MTKREKSDLVRKVKPKPKVKVSKPIDGRTLKWKDWKKLCEKRKIQLLAFTKKGKLNISQIAKEMNLYRNLVFSYAKELKKEKRILKIVRGNIVLS